MVLWSCNVLPAQLHNKLQMRDFGIGLKVNVWSFYSFDYEEKTGSMYSKDASLGSTAFTCTEC